MKWFLRGIAMLVAILVLAIVLSFALPAQTRHTRAIVLKQTPEPVFTLLSDVEKLPTWNRNLEKVDILPPVEGKEAIRQQFKGGTIMTVVTTESLSPTHLVRTIRDTNAGDFSGSWTYKITPVSEGCEVALTERLYIVKRSARFLRWLFGSTKHIDQHLADLAKHFGQRPIISSK